MIRKSIRIAVLAACALATTHAAASERLERLTADAIERVGLVNLRLALDPVPGDYRLAMRTFELAADLVPEDANLARRVASAAWGVGDPELLDLAGKRVVRADPDDTVAQLRLITSRIGRLQTVEERLEMYNRFLGEQGRKLAPSIRSRLAVDAALLEHELGNPVAFGDRISDAIELDGTNKEAILLAIRFFGEHVNEPGAMMDLEARLLMADPVDPNVHMAICRRLAGEGALLMAARFHDNALALYAAAGALEPRHDVEQLALLWGTQGPEAVVEEIGRRLRSQRAVAQGQYELDLMSDVPEEDLVPPESVHLHRNYEQIRLLAAVAALDDAAIRESLAELKAISDEKIAEHDSPTLIPGLVDLSRLADEAALAFVDLQGSRAFSGIQEENDRAIQELPGILEGRETWKPRLQMLFAWLAFQRGQVPEAKLLLENSRDNSGYARMLRGHIQAREGRPDLALETYDAIVRDDPLNPVGAWARSQAMGLRRISDPITATGRDLELIAAGIPAWVDRAVRDPKAFMSLTIKPVEDPVTPPELARVRVQIRNISPISLSVGSDRPINSRVLLTPTPDYMTTLLGDLQPEVLELTHRLRLRPREVLETEVSVASGYTGLLLIGASNQLIRQRWRAVQGFRMGERGATVPGPVCLADETPTIVQLPLNGARLAPQALADRVRGAEGDDLVDAVFAAASLLYRAAAEQTPAQPVGSLVEALGDRYARAADLERAYMLATLPTRSVCPPMVAFDQAVRLAITEDARAGKQPSTLEIGLILITRVANAEDTLLDAVLSADNPMAAELAMLMRDRIADGRPAITTVGPSVARLGGMTRSEVGRNLEEIRDAGR